MRAIGQVLTRVDALEARARRSAADERARDGSGSVVDVSNDRGVKRQGNENNANAQEKKKRVKTEEKVNEVRVSRSPSASSDAATSEDDEKKVEMKKASALANALGTSAEKRPSNVNGGQKKKVTSGDDVDWEKDLTPDEQQLIETGRGRRGEALQTPLGWCYFTRNNETAKDVGKKIGVEPLTVVSLNRWTLKLKLKDTLCEGTRLWLQPQEAWEHEYIAEDRTKELEKLFRRIHEVFPDFVKSCEPLKHMKKANLSTYKTSGRFYEEILQTLVAAELQARAAKNEEQFTDVQTIRERFCEKWIECGFLPPSEIVNRSANSQS